MSKNNNIPNLNKKQPQVDYVYYFQNALKGERIIFNTIIELSHHFKNIYTAQQTIANKTGYTREWVNKILGKLHRDGILWKAGRYYRTCFYRVPSEIFKYQNELKHLLPALGFFSLFLLFPAPVHTGVINNIFKYPVSRYGNGYCSRKERLKIIKRENFVTNGNEAPITKITETKERVFDPERISKALNQVKNIDLTLEQMIDISGYPSPAIEYADKLTGWYGNQKEDRWKYFVGCANSYCKKNNVKPDYGKRDFWKQIITEYDSVLPVKQRRLSSSDNFGTSTGSRSQSRSQSQSDVLSTNDILKSSYSSQTIKSVTEPVDESLIEHWVDKIRDLHRRGVGIDCRDLPSVAEKKACRLAKERISQEKEHSKPHDELKIWHTLAESVTNGQHAEPFGGKDYAHNEINCLEKEVDCYISQEEVEVRNEAKEPPCTFFQEDLSHLHDPDWEEIL